MFIVAVTGLMRRRRGRVRERGRGAAPPSQSSSSLTGSPSPACSARDSSRQVLLQSQGVAVANWSWSVSSCSIEQGLCTSVQYTTVYKKEGTLLHFRRYSPKVQQLLPLPWSVSFCFYFCTEYYCVVCRKEGTLLHCPQVQSQGVAAANFVMECEFLLNRTGALYFCTSYYCVQKRGNLSRLSSCESVRKL